MGYGVVVMCPSLAFPGCDCHVCRIRNAGYEFLIPQGYLPPFIQDLIRNPVHKPAGWYAN
jgi:hypothetical protein